MLVVIQGSSGSDATIACISARSPACHKPSARPGSGSRHNRSRCLWPASSLARRASRASASVTVWPGVSGGIVIVNVVRNSAAPGWGGRAGSLGCGDSGVTSSVRHTRSGIEARTCSSRVPSAAANSPRVRHSPGRSGGRHSRSRCCWAASSRDRLASRARICSTASSGVPSGTEVVIVTRYSMMSAFPIRPNSLGILGSVGGLAWLRRPVARRSPVRHVLNPALQGRGSRP